MAARTRSRCKVPSHTEDALASRVRRRAFLLRHFVFARFVPDPSGDAGVASRAQNTTTPTTDKETRERHIHRALTARYPHHTPHPTLTPPHHSPFPSPHHFFVSTLLLPKPKKFTGHGDHVSYSPFATETDQPHRHGAHHETFHESPRLMKHKNSKFDVGCAKVGAGGFDAQRSRYDYENSQAAAAQMKARQLGGAGSFLSHD